MKKIFYTLLAMVLTAGVATARDDKEPQRPQPVYRSIVISQADDTKLALNLNKGMTLGFTPQELTIEGTTAAGATATMTLPRAEVKGWTFTEEGGNDVAGIGFTAADKSGALTFDGLTISGLQPGVAVTVSDTAGRATTLTADSAGRCTLPVDRLASGVYVVAAGSQSIKVAISR